MNIFELFDPESPGRYTEKQDHSTMKLKDLRKTRLSLEQINRMRMMNDVRKVEHEEKLKKVKKQYKAPSAEAPAAPGGI